MLENIPSNLWSAALGSGLTILGVIITNIANNKRHRLQLEHASIEKDKDRKANLKHAVYLHASEEMVKASSYIGSLAQEDSRNSNIAEPLQSFYAATNKLMMIAGNETAQNASNLISFYTQLVFRLLERLIPIQDLKIKIEIESGYIEKESQEVDRLQSEISHLLESGSYDDVLLHNLRLSLNTHQEQRKHHQEDRAAFWDKHQVLHLEYTKALLEEMSEITSIQLPLLVCIRKELDIDTDIEKYKKIMFDQKEQINQSIQSLLNAIEKNKI